MAGEMTCPKCGVAVTPGYVRCPKCRAQLPMRAHRQSVSPGGTAVAPKPGMPVWPIFLVLLAGGFVLVAYVIVPAVRGKDKQAEAAPAPTAPAGPAAPAQVSDRPTAPTAAPAPTPIRPSPESVAADLERSLKKQHLWATVQVIGDHADIRSGLCKDPGMAAQIDAIAPSLKAAGTARLRCLEQSGTVVFQRDL